MSPISEQDLRPGRYAAVAALSLLMTVLATPLVGHLDLVNIALLFVLTVVIAAVRWGRGPGVFSAFAAVACFDFFFVPPRFSFTVEQAQYLITFGVMLAVSLVISHLTGVSHDKALEAEQRAGESTLLHALASELSAALTLAAVNQRLNSVLGRHLGLSATLFLPAANEHVQALLPPEVRLDAVELLVANGVYASGQSTHTSSELRDGAQTLLLPLAGSTHRRGVLGLYHQDNTAGAPPAEALGFAIAAVVAIAVERIDVVAAAQAGTVAIQSERLRSSILSAISHDLRTPLTVLYGLADTLVVRDDLPDDCRSIAATLRDQSHRLHRMVDNLLDMARLKSGHVVLQRDWQSVAELLGACVRTMTPWLDVQRIRFELPADLPLVKVDAQLFERVFSNLLENAAKYSPPVSVISVYAAVEAPGWLTLGFANAGPGFPPARIDAVFDLFERGEGESTVPGVGIGLGVCRAIVEAHGGTITAHNLADGCEVRLRLPLGVVPLVPSELETSLPLAAVTHD